MKFLQAYEKFIADSYQQTVDEWTYCREDVIRFRRNFDLSFIAVLVVFILQAILIHSQWINLIGLVVTVVFVYCLFYPQIKISKKVKEIKKNQP